MSSTIELDLYSGGVAKLTRRMMRNIRGWVWAAKTYVVILRAQEMTKFDNIVLFYAETNL